MKEKLKKLFSWSIFRFALVGAVNTLVGMGIMFGLYNLAHCSYWLSSAANYVLTSILSFFLNKYFTFKSKEKSPHEEHDKHLHICLSFHRLLNPWNSPLP